MFLLGARPFGGGWLIGSLGGLFAGCFAATTAVGETDDAASSTADTGASQTGDASTSATRGSPTGSTGGSATGPTASDGASATATAAATRDTGDGTTGPCVPSGAEDCFNGLDDDCNGAHDCGDAACTDRVVCLPERDTFSLGVLVAADEACPEGFTGEVTPLFAELDEGAGCTGCTCGGGTTTCTTEVYWYASEAECLADTSFTGGTATGVLLSSTTCTLNPITDALGRGYRMKPFTAASSCPASGTGAPSAYTWGKKAKFCRADAAARGCATGQVCAHKDQATKACVMKQGGQSCEAPYLDRQVQWFEGAADTRSCGACRCDAQGGGCDNVSVAIGSDYVCTDTIYLSPQDPQSCTYSYSPPARLDGTPASACVPSSAVTGALTGTGQQTLCCAG